MVLRAFWMVAVNSWCLLCARCVQRLHVPPYRSGVSRVVTKAVGGDWQSSAEQILSVTYAVGRGTIMLRLGLHPVVPSTSRGQQGPIARCAVPALCTNAPNCTANPDQLHNNHASHLANDTDPLPLRTKCLPNCQHLHTRNHCIHPQHHISFRRPGIRPFEPWCARRNTQLPIAGGAKFLLVIHRLRVKIRISSHYQ